MNKNRYDVVIVGGGPAGYTAALYCARSGFSVLVLEKLSPGGQMATTSWVENYPGFDEGIDGFELAEKMKKGADRFGVESAFEEVKGMDLMLKPKKIHTTAGVVTADTVILAMGASPREIGLPEESGLRGRGVAYCAACDGMMYRNKKVVVVGGGNSAVADALLLSKICGEVHLVHRRDKLRASRVYMDPLKDSGVIFHWDSRVSKITHDQKVSGVELENVKTGEKTELSCDGVFVAVGRKPETALVKDQVELDSHGYIIADETTCTNLPGVFAIGDIRTKPMRQIVTAAADGAVASRYVEEYLSTGM